MQGPTENHMYVKWAPCWKIFIMIILSLLFLLFIFLPIFLILKEHKSKMVVVVVWV